MQLFYCLVFVFVPDQPVVPLVWHQRQLVHICHVIFSAGFWLEKKKRLKMKSKVVLRSCWIINLLRTVKALNKRTNAWRNTGKDVQTGKGSSSFFFLSQLSSFLGGGPPPPPGWVNIDGVTLILSVTPLEINWVVIAVFDPFPLSAASHPYSSPVCSTLMSQSIHFMHPASPHFFKKENCDAFCYTQRSGQKTSRKRRGGECG